MLAKARARVGAERSTRQAPLGDDEVDALLAEVDEVILVRGRRPERRPAAAVQRDDLRGPTGNYRAPIVRIGPTLLVGYHPPTLADLLRQRPPGHPRRPATAR